MCLVCDHPLRAEIENDIKNGIRNIGKKYGIRDQYISYHKLKCMGMIKTQIAKRPDIEPEIRPIIISKCEFCSLCLEYETCKYDHKLSKCPYWKEYQDDLKRRAG